MESIDKLREYVDKQRDEYNNHNVSFVWQLSTIAEEIEAEIAERYMELPVDADGEPIHMGDTVEGELVFDDVTAKGTVTTYHIHDNDEPDTVYIKVDCGNGTWTIKELIIKRCHHIKPRTLEDVLRDVWQEALDYAKSDMWRNPDEVFAERADEIRELLGGDAE